MWCGNEQRNILNEIWKRKANWIGHILRRNCLLQQVIEGKIKGQIEVTRSRGRRRKKLLDDLKDRRGYCQLKEEALDRTMWRIRFGRGFGLVVWQITDDDDDDDKTYFTRVNSLVYYVNWNISLMHGYVNTLSFKCGLRDTRYCKQEKIIFPHKFVKTPQSTKRIVLIHAPCSVRDHVCHFSRCKTPTNAGSTDTTHTGTLLYRLLSDCLKVCDTVATLSLLVVIARSSRSALAGWHFVLFRQLQTYYAIL